MAVHQTHKIVEVSRLILLHHLLQLLLQLLNMPLHLLHLLPHLLLHLKLYSWAQILQQLQASAPNSWTP